MKVLITEKLSEHRYKTPEGYLVCVDAILARTGKQVYKHSQVYDGSTDEITDVEVDRKPEQVFSPQAIASFENKPLTIQHPNEPVTTANHKDLYHGFARDIRRAVKRNGKILTGSKRPTQLQDGDQELLVGNIIVTTSEAIEEIENGLEFLSCGYDCDITQTDNPEQINIRGNHVALCDNPRAGITMLQDNTEPQMKHIVKVLTGALDTQVNDADNVVEWKTYEELGKKLRRLGFTDIRVHQIMEALQDGKPIKNVGNLTFKRVTDSLTEDDASDDAKQFLLATYNNYCKGKTYADIPKMWNELRRVMTAYKNGIFKWSTYSYKYDYHIHAVVSGNDSDYNGSPKVWLTISLDFEKGYAKVVHEINNRVSFKQEFTIPKIKKDSIAEDAINYVVMCEQLYNGVAVKSRAPWIVFRAESKLEAEQFVRKNNAKTKSLVGFSQHYYIK